jgi:hypothetical protein
MRPLLLALVASAALSLKSGATATLHVRLTRAGRALLRRRGTLSVAVKTSVKDGGGTALPATAAFSGRRR